MQEEKITIKVVGDLSLLYTEPYFIEKMFFEPSNESIWAKHTFASKSIFVGICPKELVSLFTKKLIRIKAWKLIPSNNEIILTITLNDNNF